MIKIQGPNAVLNTMTLPPGATQTQQRIVIDGIRGAMFLYQNGGQLVGSLAISSGTDPYGNFYPRGFSTNDAGNNTSTWNGAELVFNFILNTPLVLNPAGLFLYSPTVGTGNLIVSLASIAGTDPYGNAYPEGFNAGAGSSFSGLDFQINENGIFFYAGTPGTGNLVATITTAAGTDPFSNPYPAGLSVGLNGQGQIQLQPNINQAFDITTVISGVFTAMAQYYTGDANQMMPSMLGSMLLGTGTSTKMSSILHSPIGTEGAAMLLESQDDAGTDTPVLTFGTVTMPDGVTMVFTPIMTLLPYAQILYQSGSGSQVVVTETSGSGTIPIPVNVTSAKAECRAAGGGGGGGNATVAGAGGSGGEYAAEPNLVVPAGGTVAYSVGAGGARGAIGGNGSAGGNSTLTGSSVTVTAHGGNGGLAASGTTTAGGTGSANTSHFNGGTGAGGNPSPSFQGGGGGSGAGVNSAGNPGNTNGNGGAAIGGGGAGGQGGSQNHGGLNGSTPGGGGGGGGANNGSTGGFGANGSIRLTYMNGIPEVGQSMNFGAPFTDQFGNSIPSGMTIPVLSTAPVPSSGAALFSDANGVPRVVDSGDGMIYAIGRTWASGAPSQVINNTAPVVIGNATFNVVAGVQYHITAKVFWNTTATAGQPSIGWDGGSVTSHVDGENTWYGPGVAYQVGGFISGSFALMTGPVFTSGNHSWELEAWATFSTSGAFNLRAQTSSATDTWTISSYYVSLEPT